MKFNREDAAGIARQISGRVGRDIRVVLHGDMQPDGISELHEPGRDCLLWVDYCRVSLMCCNETDSDPDGEDRTFYEVSWGGGGDQQTDRYAYLENAINRVCEILEAATS